MNRTCGICLEDYTNLITTNCGHSFCNECITHWLNINNSCPTCRSDINLNIIPFSSTSRIMQIGTENIHNYSLHHNLLNNLLNYVKGSEIPITPDERDFINRIFNFNVDEEVSGHECDDVWVCKIGSNVLTFGKKENLNDNEFIMKHSFVLIRDKGSLFPVHPPNRVFKYLDRDKFYLCY